MLTARSSPPMGALSYVKDAHGKGHPMRSRARGSRREHGCAAHHVLRGRFHRIFWYAPCGDVAKLGCCAYAGDSDLDARLRAFAGQMGVEYDRRRGAFIPTGSDVLLERDGVIFWVTRRASSRLLPGRASTMRCIPHVYSRTHLSTRRATVRSCSPSSPRYDVSTSYAASSSIRASCTVASSWPMPHPTVPNAP